MGILIMFALFGILLALGAFAGTVYYFLLARRSQEPAEIIRQPGFILLVVVTVALLRPLPYWIGLLLEIYA